MVGHVLWWHEVVWATALKNDDTYFLMSLSHITSCTHHPIGNCTGSDTLSGCVPVIPLKFEIIPRRGPRVGRGSGGRGGESCGRSNIEGWTNKDGTRNKERSAPAAIRSVLMLFFGLLSSWCIMLGLYCVSVVVASVQFSVQSLFCYL